MEERVSDILKSESLDVGDDGEWFVQQFGQVQRALYRFIVSLLPQTADADEVFQETLIVLWRKRDQFEQGTDFLAWSRVVAKFEVFRFLRKARKDQVGLSEAAMTRLAEFTEAQARSLDRESARQDALAGCIGKLSEGARELIVLRYFRDEAVEEIAQNLGKAQSTIYSALTRARSQLGECLKVQLRSLET